MAIGSVSPMPPSTPPNAESIKEIVDDALHDESLTPGQMHSIMEFINQEVSTVWSPQLTSYFILGILGDPELRRRRIVENTLNKRIGTYPFLMADLEGIDDQDIPDTICKFHLLATYADYIVGVFEHGKRGPATELGEIFTDNSYFERSYLLVRVYEGIEGTDIDTGVDTSSKFAPYSQVQKERFELFADRNRCFWWENVEELREKVRQLP